MGVQSPPAGATLLESRVSKSAQSKAQGEGMRVVTASSGSKGLGIQRNVAIGLWFLLNISIGTLTKWIFLHTTVCATGYGCRAFNFPFAMTVIHLVVSQAVCALVIYGPWAAERPRSPQNRAAHMTTAMKLKKVGPLAACFAGSVGLGNLSLDYIYPSFKQMVGSAGPVVTVAMTVLFSNKRYNLWTWLSMPLICGGLVVCGNKEVHFSVLGIVFSVAAMVLRSAKSIIQAQLLSKEERIEPIMLLYYMAPYASVLLIIMSLLVEGWTPLGLLLQAVQDRADPSAAAEAGSGLAHVLVLLLLSGLNACFLNLLGFVVLRCTSPVTMQVLGSVKSCLGIAISVMVLGNPLHPRQALGTTVCLVGVWVYERWGGTKELKAKPSPVPSPAVPSVK